MLDIPFDQRIVYELTTPRPSAATLEKLNQFLQNLYQRTLPDGFFENNSKAKYSKQVSKWLHDEHQIDIDGYIQSQIGNMIEQSVGPTGTYNFEFTSDLHWKPGDFADSGSCFFTFNKKHRLAMMDAGGFAVKFFGDENKGVGRAWMLQLEEDSIGLFNGYGYTTDTIAKILSSYLGVSYKLSVGHTFVRPDTGEKNTTFYMNSSPVILGKELEAPKFMIPQIDNAKDCACGRVIHETDERCAFCEENANANQ